MSVSTKRFARIVIAALLLVPVLLLSSSATGMSQESGATTAGANPSKADIKALLYNAAVARGIPPEILYGIAYQESGWRQFDANGNPLDSYDGYGSGIMQVSYGSCVNYPVHKCYDTNSIRYDINYNIAAGADILIDKWNNTPSIGNDDQNCYENWFYAVWAYNGWVAYNEYPYTVYAHIGSGGAYGWWEGVPVTPVPREWRQNGYGVQVPTPQPAHYWYTPESPDSKPYRTYFPWYDNIGGRNWILMSNPASAGDTTRFALSVAGQPMGLSAMSGLPGEVPAGGVMSAKYGNLIGGPVIVGSTLPSVVSQRILWADNSLEEVPGTEEGDLSAHYYWPWYDQLTPGYKNWVLIANPNAGNVTYQLKIAGHQVAAGTLTPGQRVTPTFPTAMGGPVELTASERVIASQRVLSSGDKDFTELPGIPAEELSDRYVWTWYDHKTPGASDWIVVANPGTRAVTYEVRIAGNRVASGSISAGERVTPTFPGVMGGPVEVIASGLVIASQRVVWGPSFDELPGYRYSQLKSYYSWTWYDQASAGATNWVLVANPNTGPVSYEIRIGGGTVAAGTINPGDRVTPTFPGVMAGPVEVYASAPVMASQRVIWSGFFNEVLGNG